MRFLAITSINASLLWEIGRAGNVETALNSSVTAVSNAVTQEVARATTAEGVLSTNINIEVSARVATVTLVNSSLIAAVVTEATIRNTLGVALQANISNEVSFVTNAVSLNSQIFW